MRLVLKHQYEAGRKPLCHAFRLRVAAGHVLAAAALAVNATPAAADTFSIAAVDVATREVGSAGASCVGPFRGIGAFILSDTLPGVGVIHTQASYSEQNQALARELMLSGLEPVAILAALESGDATGNPGIRQYGIVDLTRGGLSAAFTGSECIDYKGHLTGPGYAIQGNILAGPEILHDMETAFLNTSAPLAERLMAVLQAAKVVGADTRCAVRGTSSQSAFLKVARHDDSPEPYLELVVPDTAVRVDPIDLLQAEYDEWAAQRRGTVFLPWSVVGDG